MRGLLHHAATTALLTLLPSVALGQLTPTSGTTGGTTGQTTNTGGNAIDANLTVERVDDDIVENGQIVYGRLSDCSETRQFEFRVRYAQQVPVVEAWLGVDGINCVDQANRVIQGSTVSAETRCRKLQTETNQLQLKMRIPGRDIFDRDGPDESGVTACDPAVKAPLYTVYILALSSTTTETVASPLYPAAGAVASLKATFTPYLKAPEAPRNVAPLTGETRVGISFDGPAQESDSLIRYKAYFDVGTSGGTAVPCGSGLLETETTPDANQTNLRSTKKGTSKSVYLTTQGIGVGTSVAASAVTIDAAGNESAPSQPPVCVEVVETTGFQDACSQDPNCAGSLESCSLSQGKRASFFGLGLLMLMAVGLIQRRRSR
jgi:hypothetical protein